jgi:tetratricopeptide (TPR) repeat protein
MLPIASLLAQGMQHHQAGRWQQAEQLYRQVLQADPNQFDALHLLGLLAHQRGQHAIAVDHLTRARQLQPGCADLHYNLGLVLTALGKKDEAFASYQEALRLQPRHAEAANNLGVILEQTGRPAEALARYQEAIRLDPNFAKAHGNLGNVLTTLGRLGEAGGGFQAAIRLEPRVANWRYKLAVVLQGQGRTAEAITGFRQALQLDPNFAAAHFNLGLLLKEQGHLEAARTCFEQAVRLHSGSARAHNNLGVVLRRLGKLAEAQRELQEALRLDPDSAEAHSDLGNVFKELDEPAQAATCYRQALALKPDMAEAHYNLGWVLRDQGQLDEAVASLRRAIACKADFAEAHGVLGTLLLLLGDFERGWPEYEWRHRLSPCPPRQPVWDGSDLAGQTILLYAEQGFGDTFQFVRYTALVKERGGTVVVECQRPLTRLLTGQAGIDHLVPRGYPPHCPVEVYASLGSLPGMLGTSLVTIPGRVPYLRADPVLVERWRAELAGFPGLKIGIAWQGDPRYLADRQRSIPLAHFAAVAQVSGVQLFSLQKGPGSEEIRKVSDAFAVIDLGPRLDEAAGAFMDTAAVMMGLDLVISADTAVAHLAGALGVPVWLALHRVPDWRWMLDRPDSPWYPTIRLFRQDRLGDWAGVFKRMAAEIVAISRPEAPHNSSPR